MSEGTDTRKNPTREIAHAPGVIDARESAIIRRRSAVIVGARVRSLGLAALLSMTSGCGGSGLSVSTGSSDTVPSWPPAGPTVGGDAPRETVESAAHRTPLVFTRPVPGIAVREGEAHGIGYLEVVLGETDTEARLPMMFLIHGRGDRPHIPGGPFSQLPYAMRVIMPRAPALAGEGFSWLPVVVAEGRTELLATSLHEVADRLALVIEELRAERPTLGPTLVGGFSQGGLLSFTIAIEHPEIVGIALPLAGWLPPPLEPRTTATVHNPPIRALHGADDARIPAQPTVEGVERLRALGYDVSLEVFPRTAHEMSDVMNERFRALLVRALSAIWEQRSDLADPVTQATTTAQSSQGDQPPAADPEPPEDEPPPHRRTRRVSRRPRHRRR